MIHHALIMDLVGLIYDASINPQAWPRFLERLARHMGADAALFRLSDTNNDRVHLDFSHGHDAQYLSDYREYFIHHDPYRKPLKTLPAGVFYPGQAGLSYHELEKTELYNELVKPRGLMYTVGGFAYREGPLGFQVTLHRSKQTGDYSQEEIDAFNMLIPHLQRAFRINRHMAHLEQRNRIREEALDQFRTAVILLDEQGRPEHLNRKAEALIASRKALHIVSGRLVAANTQDTSQLNRLIREALDTGMGRQAHAAGCMHLTPADAFSRPLPVLAVPLNPDRPSMGGAKANARVALLIGETPREDGLDTTLLQGLYALTPAEARLAAELAKGRSLEEICAELNTSKHTARSQLKAIFGKTGVSRQAELVSLLLSSPLGI